MYVIQVWLSYAQFELSVDDGDAVRKSRAVFQQANTAMKEADEKEERLMLLEAWKEFEVMAFAMYWISLKVLVNIKCNCVLRLALNGLAMPALNIGCIISPVLISSFLDWYYRTW